MRAPGSLSVWPGHRAGDDVQSPRTGPATMRLRRHLIVLVLAALVPILGFAAFVIRENAALQLAATERGMRETARAVALTVDKELETAITKLGRASGRERWDTPEN